MTNHKNRWRHIVPPDSDIAEWAAQTRRLPPNRRRDGRFGPDDFTTDNDSVTLPEDDAADLEPATDNQPGGQQ